MVAPLIGSLKKPILVDHLISASSTRKSIGLGYNPLYCRSGSTYGWLKGQDALFGRESWIQFDFIEDKTISSIETMSKSDGLMKTYKLSYSSDGESWISHEAEFPGGTKDNFKKIDIDPPISARMLRLHPWSGEELGGAIQVEVYGARVGEKIADLRLNLLQQIMQDDEFADCKLVCDSQQFPCHRVVLAASSSVWRAALTGGFRETLEAAIRIDDAQPQTVKALRTYLYTYEIDANQALSLLPLAHRYQLQHLFAECLVLVSEGINKDNVVDAISCMNTFIDDERVSESFEKTMDKIRNDPELLRASLRCVRRRT